MLFALRVVATTLRQSNHDLDPSVRTPGRHDAATRAGTELEFGSPLVFLQPKRKGGGEVKF